MNRLAVEGLIWTSQMLTPAHRRWLSTLPLTIALPELGAVLCHANLHHPQGWSYIAMPYAAQLTFDALAERICFFGHTHIPAIICLSPETAQLEATMPESSSIAAGDRSLINCGSSGQPRDGDARSCYVLFDILMQRVTLFGPSWVMFSRRGLVRTFTNYSWCQPVSRQCRRSACSYSSAPGERDRHGEALETATIA